MFIPIPISRGYMPIPIFFPRGGSSAEEKDRDHESRYYCEVSNPTNYTKLAIARWKKLPAYLLGNDVDKRDTRIGFVATRLYAAIFNNAEVIQANYDLLKRGVDITYILSDSKVDSHAELDKLIDGEREQKHNFEAGALALSQIGGLAGKLRAIASPEEKGVNYLAKINNLGFYLLLVEKHECQTGCWDLYSWNGGISEETIIKYSENFTSICREAAGNISNSPQELEKYLGEGRKTELTRSCLKRLNMGETEQLMWKALG